MIARRVLGGNVNGLLAYLWGPGKRDEHEDPHLVASWDGTYLGDGAALPALEPKQLESGRYAIGDLGRLLRQPVDADQFAPAKWVYHVSLRTHPDDPALSDGQWADVAREVMSSVGLSTSEDLSGCRWVAMKHGPDHIHLVATLSRQDGARADLHNDFYRMRAACHRVEQRYALVSTAPADGTAQVASSPRETSEAIRGDALAPATARGSRGPDGRPVVDRRHQPASSTASASSMSGAGASAGVGRPATVRDILRQRVQSAGAGSGDLTEFRDALAHAGVDVHLRMSTRDPDQVSGVSFSLVGGKRDRAGQAIKFSGSKLAPDLSWGKLAARWVTPTPSFPGAAHAAAGAAGKPPTPPRWDVEDEAVWAEAEQIMHAAADKIRAEGAADPDGAGDAAWAAADAARSAADLLEGKAGGPVTDAAEAMARAGRESWRRVPQRSDTGAGLRAVARMMGHAARVASVSGAPLAVRSQVQTAALLAALTALSRAVADLRETQHRTHQADAARLCAERLARVAPTASGHDRAGATRPAPPEATPDPARPKPRRPWRTAAFDDPGKDTVGWTPGTPPAPGRGSPRSPGHGR